MSFGHFPNLSALWRSCRSWLGARTVSILASAGMLAPTLNVDGLLSAARCFFLWRSKYCSPEPGMLNADSEDQRWFDHRLGVDDGLLVEHNTQSHKKSDPAGKGTFYVASRCWEWVIC
jgi:hypothetical protein